MAEGFTRAAGVEAYSAGTEPAGYVHPVAVQVMAEKGIDISGQTSKELDLNLAQTMDAVITVCGEADETCTEKYEGQQKGAGRWLKNASVKNFRFWIAI
jgi:arsenate reductase